MVTLILNYNQRRRENNRPGLQSADQHPISLVVIFPTGRRPTNPNQINQKAFLVTSSIPHTFHGLQGSEIITNHPLMPQSFVLNRL